MTRTSKALKRLGVAGLAAVTIGAGMPALLATGAQAANPATAITLSPDTASAPAGTCVTFTAKVTPATGTAATPTVDVQLAPQNTSANGDIVQFCSTTTGAALAAADQKNVPAAGTGVVNGEFTPDSTGTVTFGVRSNGIDPRTVNVTAYVEDPATENDQPTPGEPADTSVLTFTQGGQNAVTTIAVSPRTQVSAVTGDASFAATVTNSAGKPVPGVTVTFDVTQGPDFAVTNVNCATVTDQTGKTTCSYTNNGQAGTDSVTFFVNQANADNNATTPDTTGVDAGEPRDTVQASFQGAQPAGTTVVLTCATNRTNTAGSACQLPTSQTTQNYTATVKNAAGTPVQGVAIRFALATGGTADPAATTPDSETLSTDNCLTDASGQCTVTVTDTVPTNGENQTVTATITRANAATGLNETVSSSATTTYQNAVAADARNIVLSPKSSTPTVGNVQALTAKVTDRFGNGVPNVEVTFTENGTGRFVTSSSTFVAYTNASGTATAELTTAPGETPGGNTVTATITGFRNPTTGLVTPRGTGAADDECESAVGNTGGGTGNAPGATAGDCDDTASVTWVSGTPSPSPTTGTARPVLSTSTPDIQPNIQGIYTATGASPNSVLELRCYTRPSTTYFTARSTTVNANGGPVEFRILPGANTRCYARPAGNDNLASNSVVINVHTTLSLSTVRTGTRKYLFQGRNLPRRAGQLITLYRVDSAGNEIRTSNLVTDSSGIYRVTRTFTGTGTFKFKVRTSQTLNNAAGVSNTITVNVH